MYLDLAFKSINRPHNTGYVAFTEVLYYADLLYFKSNYDSLKLNK